LKRGHDPPGYDFVWYYYKGAEYIFNVERGRTLALADSSTSNSIPQIPLCFDQRNSGPAYVLNIQSQASSSVAKRQARISNYNVNKPHLLLSWIHESEIQFLSELIKKNKSILELYSTIQWTFSPFNLLCTWFIWYAPVHQNRTTDTKIISQWWKSLWIKESFEISIFVHWFLMNKCFYVFLLVNCKALIPLDIWLGDLKFESLMPLMFHIIDDFPQVTLSSQ